MRISLHSAHMKLNTPNKTHTENYDGIVLKEIALFMFTSKQLCRNNDSVLSSDL